MRTKISIFLTIFSLLLTSCNLPSANAPLATDTPGASGADAIGTAVELTTVAKLTQLVTPVVAILTDTPMPPTGTPTSPAAPCVPLVTADATIANVRSGPDTAYDVVGTLPVGGTAKILGRNDANTWWYIEFPGGVGGHAWVAGIVVTASCLPSVVVVVVAPPLPTSQTLTSTPTPEATEDAGTGEPDLVASGMQWSNPAYKTKPVSIQVKVTNSGTAPAGTFIVVWLSNQAEPGCSWTVSGLGVGESKNLDCTFTYTLLPTKTSIFYVTLKVDSGNQVAESDENNNERIGHLTVKPKP